MTNTRTIIAKAFGRNFTGNPDCPMTVARKNAQAGIAAAAKSSGVTVDQYITAMLIDSEPQLLQYVVDKNETPLESALALAAQATILRADDISTIAKALDCTDEQALAEVERGEYDAIINKVPNAVILDVDTQAALCYAVWDFKDKTGGDLSVVLGQLRANNQADNFETNFGSALTEAFSNNTDFNNAGDDPGDPGDGGYGFGSDDNPNNPNAVDTSAGAVSQAAAGSSADSSSGFSLGDLFSGLNTALTGINGASKGISGAINGVLNNIKGAASSVGSSAIQDALMKKLPLILLGILVVAIIVILIAKYANRSK